jgi:hypothetical protein
MQFWQISGLLAYKLTQGFVIVRIVARNQVTQGIVVIGIITGVLLVGAINAGQTAQANAPLMYASHMPHVFGLL